MIVADLLPRITNTLGQPYVNATVYFGEPNVDTRSNPISVFQDDTGLIELGSSLQTDAWGRFSANGAHTVVHVFQSYSMEVYSGNTLIDQVPFALGIPSSINVFGLTASGDMTEQLSTALAAAAGGVLEFINPQTYQIADQITIPDGTKVIFNGTILETLGSDTSAGAQINIGNNCTIDWLRTTTPSGDTVRRVVNITGSDTVIDRVEVLSIDQQANRDSPSQDAAFNVQGDRVDVGSLRIENWDNALRAEGANHFNLRSLEVESYVKGFHVEECDYLELQGYKAFTRSPNGQPVPGHNSLLIEQTRYSTFANMQLNDAGEHAIRVGGSVGYASRDLGFSNVGCARMGQCGFKINDSTNRTSDVTINGLRVLDCSRGGASTSNEDGLRLEQCDRITVTGFSVDFNENSSTSSFDGIYINNCTQVRVDAPSIRSTTNHGIEIVDDAGGCSGIRITSATIETAGADLVNISHGTSTVRDIVIEIVEGRNQTGYGVNMNWGGGLSQPVVISGYIDNAGLGILNGASGDSRYQSNVTALVPAITLTDGDTTPDVEGVKQVTTANTSNTVISQFDGGQIGQKILVKINDANTDFDFTSSNLRGNGGVDLTTLTTGDALMAEFDGTDWYCLAIT